MNHICPIPILFNHSILRIESDNYKLWIDPTIKFQGINLDNIYQYYYGNALVISKSENNLVNMKEESLENPDKVIIETFDLTDGVDKTGRLSVSTTFRQRVGLYEVGACGN